VNSGNNLNIDSYGNSPLAGSVISSDRRRDSNNITAAFMHYVKKNYLKT
jgi:hypothetical protein